MTDEELKELKKDMSSKKRIATEWASQVHDLVEDRLLTDYEQLSELAEKTIAACQEWKEAKSRFDQASA